MFTASLTCLQMLFIIVKYVGLRSTYEQDALRVAVRSPDGGASSAMKRV